VKCTICGSSSISNLREVYDDRFGNPNLYYVSRCKDCGHLFTTPTLKEEDLPSLYSQYYSRELVTPQNILDQAQAVLRPFSRLRRWWSGVNNQGQYLAKKGMKVLDIGCGSGASLLEAQFLGAQAFGIEADPNVMGIAKKLDLKVYCGSIKTHPYLNKKFDLVILNQVIEHIPDPSEMLRLINPYLAEKAKIILVFPNKKSLWSRLTKEKWIHWHIPYHLHHFDRDSFALLAKNCGYRVIRLKTITPNLWTILQLRACKAVIKRGEKNPIWIVAEKNIRSSKKSHLILAVSKKVTLSLLLFSVAFINRSVDAMGLGDSLMVELEKSDI